MNDYAFDVTAVVCLHVFADTESDARQIVADAQGIGIDSLLITGDIALIEVSTRTILELVYATGPAGRLIDTGIAGTDGTLIVGDAEGARLLRQLRAFRDVVDTATDAASIRAAAITFIDHVTAAIDTRTPTHTGADAPNPGPPTHA
ncbi:hypothetical protein [Nocardia sp. alder85J]|uniref:hypothetical protein n=1 Tax=Nocardia sp. alder85J TaxID=2862949 RepID=UPI001CD1F51C|nr:hypothetical protein [Nocardia sp. alder85J]MCX4094521.1 hypothetical protein [Nocardia sp. alder85J]